MYRRKKSTRKEGSKTCEGKYDGVGYGVIFHVALSLSLSSLGLFVRLFVFPVLVETNFPLLITD